MTATHPMNALDHIRDSAGRLPAWAWPGGYPIYYATGRNDVLCPACANRIHSDYVRGSLLLAMGFGDYDVEQEDWQWELDRSVPAIPFSTDLPVSHDCNWEDPDLHCDECERRIESAYAEPEA